VLSACSATCSAAAAAAVCAKAGVDGRRSDSAAGSTIVGM